MDNIEKFRKLFIDFENLTKNLLNNRKIDINDAIDILHNNHIFPYSKESDFLHFCRMCRNRLSHVNYDYKYIIYTDEFIEKLENIIKQIKNPPSAYSMSTKNITSATVEDNVHNIMNLMNEKNYTHIPIYERNRLVGIFSENSIFNYLLKEECIKITSKTMFKDILDYISIDNCNETIKFVSKKEKYNDVINDFINNYKSGEKLSCILITQNGIIGEQVEGLITSWDIIGKE